MNIAVLRITTWDGLVSNATHYYGWIEKKYGDKDEHQLNHTITASEAKKINKWIRESGLESDFEAGDLYSGFSDRNDVIKAALSAWKALYPDADVLQIYLEYMQGSSVYLDVRDNRNKESQ